MGICFVIKAEISYFIQFVGIKKLSENIKSYLFDSEISVYEFPVSKRKEEDEQPFSFPFFFI